jgi:predicted transcriptional regulator
MRLIEWLAGLNDVKILNEFIMLKKVKEEDWWDGISPEERAEIEEGIEQADRGEILPHAEVMAKYKKWL